MKTFCVSRVVLTVVASALILIAALLIIVASNEAIISDKSMELKPLIMVIYAFLFVFVAVWLFVKAFSDSKKQSAVFGVSCATVGLGSEFYGIYSDKISTGAFGITGALLIITAVSFAIVSLYKSKNKRICTCIEAVAAFVGLALTIGAVLLLGKEHIAKEAWVLLLIPACILLISTVLIVKRRFLKKDKEVLKSLYLGLLTVAILAYSVAFSAALSCTQNYIVALKLPTAIIASGFVDGDTPVHFDFAGEKAYISTKETTKRGKHVKNYFCDVNNFSEFPIEKAQSGS